MKYILTFYFIIIRLWFNIKWNYKSLSKSTACRPHMFSKYLTQSNSRLTDIIDSGKFDRPKILKIGVYFVLKCSTTVAANNLSKINQQHELWRLLVKFQSLIAAVHTCTNFVYHSFVQTTIKSTILQSMVMKIGLLRFNFN